MFWSSRTIDFLFQFISEVVLCEIFWNWGSVDKEYVDLETTDFNEDDDLQAKVWNSIVNKRLNELDM